MGVPPRVRHSNHLPVLTSHSTSWTWIYSPPTPRSSVPRQSVACSRRSTIRCAVSSLGPSRRSTGRKIFSKRDCDDDSHRYRRATALRRTASHVVVCPLLRGHGNGCHCRRAGHGHGKGVRRSRYRCNKAPREYSSGTYYLVGWLYGHESRLRSEYGHSHGAAPKDDWPEPPGVGRNTPGKPLKY